MKSCTPTTVITNCLEHSPASKPATPNAFSECSPLRTHSSDLKIKHPHQLGRILDLFREQKRCVSVHRLGIKSPISRSPRMGKQLSRKTLLVQKESKQSVIKSIQQQNPAFDKTTKSSISSNQSDEIEEKQFRKWIKPKSVKAEEGGKTILDRFNGQRRKVKINVREFHQKIRVEG